MPNRHWIVLLGLLVLVFTLACYPLSIIQLMLAPAPELSLETFQGETYTLSELRGKVVVLNFWASWCSPCQTEAPILEAVWQQYRNREVLVLGIAYVDMERSAKKFVDEYQLTYPIGLDTDSQISDHYQITGIPETIILDREGKIAEHFLLPVSEENLITVLDNLLTESDDGK